VHALTNTGEPTIFLIDDDPSMRQLIAELTRALQLPVEVFGSAVDFLKRFESSQPGCLVVEVRLPGMSGLELLEKLKRDGEFFAAIVVTADAEAPQAVRAMKAGAITFLEKPCRGQELWESLQEALKRDAEQRQRHHQIARIRRRMEQLSAGESEVLSLILAGKMNREIAETLKISVRTVEVRRAKVMEKMKASSLAELIRAALLLEIFSAKQP
jgi:two-component system, LuxR family, response regulator FixJ